MGSKETWELLSFIVTVIGLPLAIIVFLWEQRRERNNEEEEEYQLLADAYNDFLKVVLDNPDLRLRSHGTISNLTADQEERMLVIFDMLISLFERAYLVEYQPNMNASRAVQRHARGGSIKADACAADGLRLFLQTHSDALWRRMADMSLALRVPGYRFLQQVCCELSPPSFYWCAPSTALRAKSHRAFSPPRLHSPCSLPSGLSGHRA